MEKLLPGTELLMMQGDLAAQMVAGIDRFLMREIDRSVEERNKLWHRDFSSPDAYQKSVQTNRRHFQHCLGAVDARLRLNALEYVNSTAVLPLDDPGYEPPVPGGENSLMS